MNKNTDPHWLEWAKELQFIAQAGLTYKRYRGTLFATPSYNQSIIL